MRHVVRRVDTGQANPRRRAPNASPASCWVRRAPRITSTRIASFELPRACPVVVVVDNHDFGAEGLAAVRQTGRTARSARARGRCSACSRCETEHHRRPLDVSPTAMASCPAGGRGMWPAPARTTEANVSALLSKNLDHPLERMHRRLRRAGVSFTPHDVDGGMDAECARSAAARATARGRHCGRRRDGRSSGRSGHRRCGATARKTCGPSSMRMSAASAGCVEGWTAARAWTSASPWFKCGPELWIAVLLKNHRRNGWTERREVSTRRGTRLPVAFAFRVVAMCSHA